MTTRRSVWSLLPSRRGRNPTATELYGRVVAQARSAPFYASLGVPDTPEGRLELIMLHMVLVQERLMAAGEAGAAAARELSEAFVADLDDCLREMAVSDLAVPRKVKKAAAALFDRSRDYGAALARDDPAGLAGLVEKHLLMLTDAPAADSRSPHAVRIAAYAQEARRRLAKSAVDAVVSGELAWPEPLERQGQ